MWQDSTREWTEYQAGIDYNNKINLYAKTELNWNFYNDKQWEGIKTNGLSKWTFNICKSAINYFVASIMSNKVKLQYSSDNTPDEPEEGTQEFEIKQFTDLMSAAADVKWEKDKMDSKLRQALLDASVTGDMCAYVYWDPNKETGQLEKGDFVTEIIDGINVMFGNPNNPNVEAQPYILIVGRDMVSTLKEEAKLNGIEQRLIDTITADEETQYQAGQYGKVELDNKNDAGKTLYIIKLWKKNGETYWNKSTRYCPIRKDVAMGIKRYPLAWGNWDKIKNSYHGLPVIEGVIDNQISINQLFAMVSYWMKMSAFGKVVYDSSRLASWSNQLGTAIPADGDINGIVYQLQAGNFNNAVIDVIELAIKYTKDFIGANDTALGQVNPEQASGIAIMSTAKQAAIPLENLQSNLYQFVEDIGLIWGEFFLRKYQNRKLPIKENNKTMMVDYNSMDMAEKVLLTCNVDVGPSKYWDEIAGIQTLDNLLAQGHINKLQYFERMKGKNLIPDVQGLIDDTMAEMEQQAQLQQQQDQQMMQQQGMEQDQQMAEQQQQEQQYEQMAMFLESLPPETQQKIMSLPPEQQESTILKMMQDDAKNSMK